MTCLGLRGPALARTWGALLACAALSVRCGEAHREPDEPSKMQGTGGTRDAGAGGRARQSEGGEQALVNAGAAGDRNGEGGVAAESTCSEIPQRLVRLSRLQLINAIGELIGSELAQRLRTDFGQDAHAQSFPPLVQDGAVVSGAVFNDVDQMAQITAAHVRERFETLTGCGEAPSDACALSYLRTLAIQAFRGAGTEAALDNVLAVYAEARSSEVGASVEEAAQHSVHAIFASPIFLYRTEFGNSEVAQGELPLTAVETANWIAFFLTGGPPDSALLQAAAANKLTTREELEPHVDRLLAGEAAKDSLAGAMFSYFGGNRSSSIVLDAATYPAWDAQLADAMWQEARGFLRDTLWSEPLSALLRSRATRVNASLASIYGISFPPPDGVHTGDGFAEVELPDVRAGVLTQAASLVALSRPDGHSAIRRGLWVNAAFACAEIPAFPADTEAIAEGMRQAAAALVGATERERAEYRQARPLCAQCHSLFDAYGVALERFDATGAYRETDPQGRSIDPAVKLPPAFGGVAVSDAASMALMLADSDVFVRCLARNLIVYALTEQPAAPLLRDGCEATEVADRYRASGKLSFTELAREVALSRALSVRVKGPLP